jgi:hypothetical protein
MTVVDRHTQKVTLHRNNSQDLWECIQRHFATDDLRRWKYLAMFALREMAGWNLEQIGLAMGHPRGHVCRCLRKIREDLRAKFELDPMAPSHWEMVTDPDLDSEEEGTPNHDDWQTNPQ